jgi:hypothetical protein
MVRSMAATRRRLILLLGLLPAAAPSLARATDPTARNLAEHLFAEAKKLMADGKYDEACPKLAESERLDPGGGTILNLAVCHEQIGRFASAWSEFREAIDIARTDGRHDREVFALDHLSKVEPKVSHVSLVLDRKVDIPGLALKLDGQAISRIAWSSPLPVDPGPHEITASAPGKQDRRVIVQMIGNAENKSVSIPALDDAMSAPPDAFPDRAGPEAPSAKRTIGLVLGGVGLAALGVGSVFGIAAIQKRHDSDASCTGSTCTTTDGVIANNDAKTFANYANVGIGVGVVGLAVGAFLVLTSGGESRAVSGPRGARVEVAPAVGAHGSTLELSGAW